MKENTDGKVFCDLWNSPPMRKRTVLFPDVTPEDMEEAVKSLVADRDNINRELEERLAPYTGNSAIWCWTPWGGFWRRC
ncbi:MAG TPA: hypothetical protein ENI66_00075 [Candidatus Yonathbacteria bacterium]|mgnify:CR=1 FL=1|nr:hypothetical protein [Candidatus Yonathbacteria bacterium]